MFAVAKVALVVLRAYDGAASGLLRPAALPALLFHDAWVAAAFLVIDVAMTRVAGARVAGALYVAAVAWVAFNVPVARIFSTPLTWTMLGAAGTALLDSIRAYVTPLNLGAMALVLMTAAVAPKAVSWLQARTVVLFASRRLQPGRVVAPALLVSWLALVTLGPVALRRVPTVGLHRNALGALVISLLDRRAASQPDGNLGLPPLPPEGEAVDLTRFAGAASGRNVIWINLESTAAQYLLPWGAPAPDPMPAVTALARDAWIFDAAYAAHPESIKGLFSMLCATATAAHSGADRYTEARVPCSALPSRLQAAGYRTALFHSGWFAYLGMQGIVDRRGFDRLVDAGDIESRYRTSFGVDEPTTVERALAWIDEDAKKARPFLLMYLPIAGHHPYNSAGPPDDAPPFPRDSALHEYLDDLHHGDRSIQRLVEGVRARGLEERTLWVIVGDHGEAFFQHEGNFAHTLFAFEENVHVPLLVRAPGLIQGAQHVPQVASTIDLAPTVLALLGLEAPAIWQGRSLLPAVPGAARFYVDQAVWTAGLRSGPWKLLLDVDSGRTQLFQLAQDPSEKHDRAQSEPERTRLYREHLATWAVQQRARFAR